MPFIVQTLHINVLENSILILIHLLCGVGQRVTDNYKRQHKTPPDISGFVIKFDGV